MRALLFLVVAMMLPGCVYRWDKTAAPNPDPSRYTLIMQASRETQLFGKEAWSGRPDTYSINDCFNGTAYATLGLNPLDRVCRQYEGVDLRKEDPALLACFPRDAQGILHPWLAQSITPACQAFIKRLKGAP